MKRISELYSIFYKENTINFNFLHEEKDKGRKIKMGQDVKKYHKVGYFKRQKD